jgi:hypothetical protein
MKKILTLSGLAATLTLSASVAMADLNTCVNAAMRRQEPARFQKVYGHEFHCKHVEFVPLGGGATKVIGQLSHAIILRPDDQVYYEFVIRNGTIVKDTLKRKIKAGGLSPLIGVAATVIGAYYGVPISPETAEGVSRKLAGQVTGRGWEEAAEAIVSTVALKMASEAQAAHAAQH